MLHILRLVNIFFTNVELQNVETYSDIGPTATPG